jgi:hypothetical protein
MTKLSTQTTTASTKSFSTSTTKTSSFTSYCIVYNSECAATTTSNSYNNYYYNGNYNSNNFSAKDRLYSAFLFYIRDCFHIVLVIALQVVLCGETKRVIARKKQVVGEAAEALAHAEANKCVMIGLMSVSLVLGHGMHLGWLMQIWCEGHWCRVPVAGVPRAVMLGGWMAVVVSHAATPFFAYYALDKHFVMFANRNFRRYLAYPVAVLFEEEE